MLNKEQVGVEVILHPNCKDYKSFGRFLTRVSLDDVSLGNQ